MMMNKKHKYKFNEYDDNNHNLGDDVDALFALDKNEGHRAFKDLIVARQAAYRGYATKIEYKKLMYFLWFNKSNIHSNFTEDEINKNLDWK
jgi:hypothetical protein